MLRPTVAVICMTAVVVTQLWIGRVNALARTPIKWLINTGNLAGRWPPPQWTGRNGCSNNTATPNTISRMQMIRGGTAAVLVMPTGDGGQRCCADGTVAQFSLGLVCLKHGINNLYPIVQPFPDWRTFVDVDSPDPEPVSEQDRETTKSDEIDQRSTEILTEKRYGSNHDRQRIVNAVDAFLDDRGRILWILDAGRAGEDACHGNTPTSDRTASEAEKDDQSLQPKFVAIDVYTNQIINIVSLSRVWRPGVSCFQYIVSIYLDADENDNNNRTSNNETTRGSDRVNSCTLDWPLVVVGDAGTNRVLVYTHSNDRFAEIILPMEEEHNALHDADKKTGTNDPDDDGDSQQDVKKPKHRRHSRWPTPPIRDILYLAPLSIRPGQLRLLITYYGCREVYKLRLQLSTSDPLSYEDNPETGTTSVSLSPIIGTLAVLGRKPCRMVILGTDRRQTDVIGENFAGGGTTVYFRLENTNDIWSWKIFSGRKKLTGSFLYIDERDFRLVRLGRTCRVPVAISAAPASVENGVDDVDRNSEDFKKTDSQKQIRQILWMLETNFVDHFAGTADRMGANAKLQPIEVPLNYDNANLARSLSFKAMMQNLPLRIQPTKDLCSQKNSNHRKRQQSSKRCSNAFI
ncbi:uncharacterized protein LOC112597475 [Melanaphis sacchari]|uniref:uncharacterized protein LOC112597475 n=1 Tax=Melanaphis sacchari TaxID=742174 RepID=UPI000DC12F38|nr:uncharacterized protein LOC112597475 [Melanaphis sacchari]